MEILPTVRKWLSSVSSQSYDSVSQQTPDSLLEKARKGSFPSAEQEKSVMASIPSKEYIPPTPVRPFSEEISAAVREQYQKFQQPKEVVRFLSELAIDPTTYIPASKGIGITAAGLGILTGLLKAGTIVRSPSRLMPNLKSQIGAFRPSGSVISPLALKDAKADIQKAKDWTARDNSPDVLLASKISDKELQRYGTPEFLLDSRLTSTQNELFEKVSVRPKAANDPARSDYLQRRWTYQFDDTRLGLEEDRKYLRGTMEDARNAGDVRQGFGPDYISHLPMNMEDIGYSSGKVIKRVDELARTRKDLVSHVRAKSDAVRAGKDFYIADNRFVNQDIGEAIRKYADDLDSSPLSPDQLSKKSLQQLLMHADDLAKSKAEILRKEEESLQSLPEFTKARTATLQAEQGLPGGFVELKQPADFGAETEFLNHCVGAGGYNGDTKKYLFQHHPISGREVLKNENSSYSKYKRALDSGESRFFSYRPEGVPELTVEVGIKNKAIRQVYGKNDRLPTTEERQKVRDFVDAELGGKHRFTSLDNIGLDDWIPE
jgi:hypothetical protein